MKTRFIVLWFCLSTLLVSWCSHASPVPDQTLTVSFTTDKSTYDVHSLVRMTMNLTNTGNKSITLTNPTPVVFVYDETGVQVRTLSDNRSLRSDIFREKISAGHTITCLNWTWNLTDNEYTPLPAGTYTLTAYLSMLDESFQSTNISRSITIQVIPGSLQKKTPGFDLLSGFLALIVIGILHRWKTVRRP